MRLPVIAVERAMFRPTSRFAAVAVTILAAITAAATPPAAAADAPADDWTLARPADVALDAARLAALDQAIVDGKYKGITSVLVLRDGKLAHEGYFNGGARDTPNDMRSATKTVTALLVGAAIARGKIAGADAPLYAFFKDRRWQHADPRKAKFTLEDLLTMSSRWDCNDDNPYSRGNEEHMYVTEDWTQFALDLPIRGYAPWDTKPEDAKYGRSFSYCTAGSFLLGAVVERATGTRLDRFAREALEAPLGIDTVQWNLAPEGVGMGGGGTRYRSRDIAKLGELIRMQGEWRGKRVLPAAWIEAMTTPHAEAREATDYGYQMWRFTFPRGDGQVHAWAMSGNGGNYVFVVRELGLVAVITTRNYNQGFAHPQSQEIFRDYVLAAVR
jgi:CubicO group peptidase (beta-lactamase class C family)